MCCFFSPQIQLKKITELHDFQTLIFKEKNLDMESGDKFDVESASFDSDGSLEAI